MIEYEHYYTIANEIYAWALQLITAYFFYRFCRIFISNKSVWIVALVYLGTVFSLEMVFGDISNFGVYLFASLTAFLILLPIKNINVALKLFIVITYFSIRWMAPTILTTFYTPINTVTFNLLEAWIIPKTNNISMAYLIYTCCMIAIMIILYYIALWLVIYFYQKYMNLNKRILTTRELFILILPALSGMSSYFMMNKYHETFGNEQSSLILQQFHGYWALHNTITLLAMFTVLILIQKLAQKRLEEQKALLLMNQSNQLQQHLASIDALYKEMRYMKHDLHNHLTMIERLIEKGSYHEAAKYLDAINAEAHQVVPTTQSGNAIIDLLIQEKYNEAIKGDSILDSTLIYPQFAEIDVYDLCILLHNALDNAIRATKYLDGARIEMTSIQHKTGYLLTIRNPYSETLNWHDGQLSSTKEESLHGGLGLQIIHDIVGKYHGNIDIETTAHTFELTMLFLLKKSNTPDHP